MGLESDRRPPREPGPPSPEVLSQLDCILASAPFRTSKRCSDLLKHVVQATCDGHADQLKERTLGVAVFDRDPDYDTNQDPVVRTTAGQVRKRLAQYYLEPGRQQELRIDLPAGAYVPQIHQPSIREPDREPARVTGAVLPAHAAELQPARGIGKSALIIGVGTLVVLLAAAFFLNFWHSQTDVDRFWAPILKQPVPIVLCVGQGHTYKLKGDLDRLFDGDAGPSESALVAPQTIPLNDLVPVWDRTIGINDARTLVRLTALFAGRSRSVLFRGGRSTSLSDLRGRPVVLIGAFNNSWTLSLTGELRFYFDEDAAGRCFLVRDRQHSSNRAWQVRSNQDATQDHEDFAIVSRVFNPTTEQPVIVAAGIQGGGTAAAGEFLTNGNYLSKALQTAPAHSETKNLQFVLKTRLLSGTAGPPEVVAAYYW